MEVGNLCREDADHRDLDKGIAWREFSGSNSEDAAEWSDEACDLGE